MIQSYRNTSFSPERRGEGDFNYYTQLLKDDLEKLGENKGNYERKFIAKIMLFYHRQSRCASSMITGPANFNYRRNSKAMDSRDRAIQDFDHWRTRYFRLVNRVRTLSPEDEIDVTLEELEALETRKEIYKAADKIKAKEEKIAFLQESGQLTDRIKNWIEQGWTLSSTSLTTKIRERKKKLEVMRARIVRKTNFEKIEFAGGFVDIENDRVIIKHDTKPPREVLDVLRTSGFKYSPKTSSWVRKHTENAVYQAKRIIPRISISQQGV
ncbi:hypothetical protein MASR1M48_17130 [Lactococcus petauri]